MATKARKKSSRKTTKKTARKKAQVELDPATVLEFEAYLREGLVASGSILMSTERPSLRAGATVKLDSDSIAEIGKILRSGLVSSAAVLASEFPQTTTIQATRKTSKRKPQGTRKGRAVSKKR